MTDRTAVDMQHAENAAPSGAGVTLLMSGRITAIVAAIFVTAIIVLGLTGCIEKWLWMTKLDYVSISWTVLSVQCAVGALAFGIAFGVLWFDPHRAVKAGADSLCVESDFPEYGKMLFYEPPKDKLIYRTNQIQAMINQNAKITPRSRGGSRSGTRMDRG